MSALRRLVLTAAVVLLAPRASHAQCPVAGFDVAAFGDTGISMGNGNTDSYNSASGPYATTACTNVGYGPCAGGVETNSTSSGGISLGPVGSVQGSCTIGAGAPTSNITPNSGNCTSTGSQGAPLSLPIPTLPGTTTNLGAINGNVTISASGDYQATSITETGLSALNSTATGVVLYLTGSGSVINTSGNGAITNSSVGNLPQNFIIMCTSTVVPQTISLTGNGNAYFALYCPLADITIAGNGTIYGAVVGKSVTFNGNNASIHYDQALATYANNNVGCNAEVSRSSPVVASLAGTDYVVQGTTATAGAKVQLSLTNAASWSFPAYKGHMRARTVASITGTASSYSSGTILFDASGKTPAANYTTCGTPVTGSCRYIFTNTNTTPASGVTFHPSTLSFNDTNAPTIGPKILAGLSAANSQTVVHTMLNATVGGVDRSTVAVIEASGFAGNGARPTVAYFGGADGMVHAVCASTDATVCTHGLGTELWAFMPRVELPLVAYNDQRIDGSVHVADMFGDFTNNPATGQKSWHTVLTFQTGYTNTAEGGAAASYGIDVTDPSQPVLLWEYTTPSPAAASDFGTGLVSAMGPSLVNGVMTNLAVLETNNGGTGTAGMVATAVQVETGAKVWQFTTTYPVVAAVPAGALPGGAVPVDLTGAGLVTDVLMGDLYGDLWRLNAQTGASQNGTSTPLFKYSYAAATDKHPIGAVPAIYSDGNNQYVAVAPGGYADQTNMNTNWSLGTQYLVSVKVKATSNPVLDTGAASNSSTGDLRLKQAIAAGSKAYSQPTVVGNQMFITSDMADVNAPAYGANSTGTGRVLSLNGINGTATSNSYDTITSSIYGGASSLVSGHDSAGNIVLVGSSSDKQVQVGTTAISGAGTGVATTAGALGAGTSVDFGTTSKLTRNLWLRTM